MNSSDIIPKSRATARASGFVKEYAILILYQPVEESYKIAFMDTGSEAFKDGTKAECATKEYIVSLDTGNDTYDVNKFIPDSITQPIQENKTISMLNSDKTLHKDAYQFTKSFTFTEPEGVPYFQSGELK